MPSYIRLYALSFAAVLLIATALSMPAFAQVATVDEASEENVKLDVPKKKKVTINGLSTTIDADGKLDLATLITAQNAQGNTTIEDVKREKAETAAEKAETAAEKAETAAEKAETAAEKQKTAALEKIAQATREALNN